MATTGSSPSLSIKFLNIGQGDSILITCPDRNSHVLIDSGNSNQNYPESEESFKKLISKYVPNKNIDIAIATHSHTDHLYGFKWLSSELSGYRVGKFIDNGPINDTESSEVRNNFIRQNTRYLNIRSVPIDKIKICGISNSSPIYLEIFNLHPSAKSELNCPDNLNDCSIVMKLVYQNSSTLLSADTTEAWEKIAIKEFSTSLEANILKVGHHGSDSCSEEFLETVNPEYAIISSGNYDLGTTKEYGYPTVSVITRLNNYFKKKFPITTKEYIPIWACDKSTKILTCSWKKIPSHPRILSTSSLGTIKFNIGPSSLSPAH
jgi:competence protein ComEC